MVTTMRIKSLVIKLGLFFFFGLAALFVFFTLFYWGPGMMDYTERLGSGYKYVSDNSLSKWIMRSGQPVIDILVIDHQYDGDFIVALRLKTILYKCEPGPFLTDKLTNELEYWLIDKANDKVFMAKDAEEFARLRKEHKVPDHLKLDPGQKEYFLKSYHELKRDELIRDDRCVVVEP